MLLLIFSAPKIFDKLDTMSFCQIILQKQKKCKIVQLFVRYEELTSSNFQSSKMSNIQEFPLRYDLEKCTKVRGAGIQCAPEKYFYLTSTGATFLILSNCRRATGYVRHFKLFISTAGTLVVSTVYGVSIQPSIQSNFLLRSPYNA